MGWKAIIQRYCKGSKAPHTYPCSNRKNTQMGINTVDYTLKCPSCARSAIKGCKTNHSLRITAATRLFQDGMDEQLIMEHTGHRSVDRVKTCKRSCEEQHKELSGMLHIVQGGDQEGGREKKMKISEADKENSKRSV